MNICACFEAHEYFVVYTCFIDLFAIDLFSADSTVMFFSSSYQLAEGGDDIVCVVIQDIDSISDGISVTVRMTLVPLTMGAGATGTYTIICMIVHTVLLHANKPNQQLNFCYLAGIMLSKRTRI